MVMQAITFWLVFPVNSVKDFFKNSNVSKNWAKERRGAERCAGPRQGVSERAVGEAPRTDEEVGERLR